MDNENARERLHDVVYARAKTLEESRQGRFPEVRGLCRTCTKAHITRAQYDEQPRVLCDALYGNTHYVPLDIMECSSYARRGELELRELTELAILIDPRDKGGQYL